TIGDPLVMFCRQVQRSFQSRGGAVHGSRRELPGEAVAPFTQFPRDKESHHLVEQPRQKVHAYPRNVADVTAASFQIGFVAGEGLRDRRRLRRAAIAGALGSPKGTGLLLCLPEIENVATIRIVEVISAADGLGPVPALAIG